MGTFEDTGGWRATFATLTAGEDLPGDVAGAAMTEILEGRATDAQIAGFIVALRMKGESIDEMVAMVDSMLAAAAPITLPDGVDAIDIVGTGGAPSRRAHALNVSTMACFVVAGAGVAVCKHGNRKASSTSGSSDLLDALGLTVELDGAGVARCVAAAGVGFCFARGFHAAMRHAGPVRAELGVPTVFNYLGPIANPARVRRQVIGVSDPAMAPVLIAVLQRRNLARAMVVNAHDRTDELVTTGPTTVWELRDGTVEEHVVHPEDLGLAVVDADAIRGGDEQANAVIARRVFAGETGPYRDIVMLNAAAGLVVGGAVDSLSAGIERAGAAIDAGAAAAALDAAVLASHGG